MPKKKEIQLTKKQEKSLQKLTPQKVMSMLEKSGAGKKTVCEAIARGLIAKKAIVADGEIIAYEPDTRNQLHAAEIALDIIGERKLVTPSGDVHYHFTSILSLMEAYDRGDPRAIRDAEKFFNTEGVTEGVTDGTEAVDGEEESGPMAEES